MALISAAVVDFETANPCRVSVCAIGGARIVDGEIVRTYHQLVKPPPPYDAFYPRNVAVHGIRPEHVADAPAFADLAPGLVSSLSNGIVVGHGLLSADLPMLDQALTAAGFPVPAVTYVCTLDLARKLLPGLASYRLPYLVQHVLGRPMTGHHDAGQDAAATAELLLGMCAGAGVDDLSPFVRHRSPSTRPLPPPKPHHLGVRVPVA